jgi:hypothetical protein
MRRPASAPVLAVIVCVAIILPLGYALSVGPAVWLACRGAVPAGLVEYGYMPLYKLGRAVPPVGRLFDWYVDLWRPALPDPPAQHSY